MDSEQEVQEIEHAIVERALKSLPEGCGPRYPLRTRLVLCSQIAENAAQEVLEHMMRRGEPEEADAADQDLARGEVERGLAAFTMLAHLLP